MSHKPERIFSHLKFLQGGGEMGELTRAYNWATHPLGVPEHWPQSLKTMVSVVLKSRFPMFIWWGKELFQFYNDAYRPSLGNNGKHPTALGAQGKDTWQEIWPVIGPLIESVLAGGESTWSEDQLIPIYRNGRLEDVYWTFSYSRIDDDNGDAGGVLVTCTETTSKILALQNLSESEARFRNMAESSDVMIAVSDESGNATYFNKAWANLTGRPLTDLLKYGWVDLIHPDDKDPYVNIYLSAFKERKPFTGEFRALNKGGGYRWLLAKGLPRFNSDNSFAGYISNCIDITDRKTNEYRMVQMLNMLPAHVVVIGGYDLIVEMLNEANLAYWNRTKETTIGLPLLEILPELADQPFPGQLRHVLATGEVVNVKESPVLFIDQDGSKRTTYVDYSYQPLRDTGGSITSVLVMSFEVTDKVEARIQLEKYAEEMQAINEELFAANEEMASTNRELVETKEHLEKAVRELASSESRFKYLIQEAPVAISIFHGRELIVESANDMILKIWGKPKSIVGLVLEKALPELEGQPFLQILDDVYTSGNSFTGNEMPALLEHEGQLREFFFDLIYQPIQGDNGQTTDILVVAIDVTEQVTARKKVENAEESLRMAIEAAGLGTWEFNPVSGDLHWSKECRSIYGMSNDQHPTYESFAEHIDPRDRLFVEQNVQEAMDPVTGGRYELSYRITRFDNSELRWIKVQGRVYFDRGKAVRFIGTVLDITEMKAAEEKSAKLVAIITSSDDAIISKTLDSVITSWNNSAERIFGYSADEIIGETIYKLIPDDRQQEEPLILARLKNGERVEHFETKRQTKDGRLIDVSITVSPLKDNEGHIIGLSKIARDITERKLDETRKNDFIGMVSHELKTPLTTLSALVQVLNLKLKNNEDAFIAGALDKANIQVKKMSAMINGFLNISRFESGKIMIDKHQFDMEELIAEVIKETELTVSSHVIQFEPCRPVLVNADRDKIGSVINNLISNAVKYSPKGKLIVVSCDVIGNTAQVAVKDEGMGIKPTDLEKLFDRYYRVESNHTQHISGFGIGLYLSAEIIKRHDGKIWVESESGVGSTFHFSLPLN